MVVRKLPILQMGNGGLTAIIGLPEVPAHDWTIYQVFLDSMFSYLTF